MILGNLRHPWVFSFGMLISFARLGPTLTKKSLNKFAMSFLHATVFPFDINVSGRGEFCCPFLIMVFSIFHVPFIVFFSLSKSML